MNIVGYNIGRFMKAKGLTQVELAKKAQISQSTLSAVINGTVPKKGTVEALCKALGVTEEEICQGNYTEEIERCPRCGSKAILVWNNLGNENCRIKCAFCEADTGEQKDKAHAVKVFRSFQKVAERRAPSDVYVLPLAELLDSGLADADDVRPVWFENRGLFVVPALVQYGGAERELELVKVLWFGAMSPKSYLLSMYNDAWRCWSRRPTAERSDAEPWVSG